LKIAREVAFGPVRGMSDMYGVTAYNAGCRTTEIGEDGAGREPERRRSADTQRRRSADHLWNRSGNATRIGRGSIPGQPALWSQSVQSVGDVDSRRDTGLSALVASLVPALRTSRISPIEALRAD
jgi:hypothetical protein